MKTKKMTSILYLISGLLFFAAAYVGHNYVFIPIGCLWIILGIINRNGKNNNKQ